MKVISVGKPPEKLATCTYCDSELSYEPSDLIDSGNGVTHLLRCPVCGEYFSPGGEDTGDCGGVEYDKVPHYPEDFYSFENGVDIKEDDINKWINESVQRLESSPDREEETVLYTASGNALVAVLRDGDMFHVVVAKKYWDGDYFPSWLIGTENE